ncbi:MAG TPA: hypothetical protein PK414_13885 [Anaerolineales bacterium]|nr:hypothetical protein [Anaerolineales bacterium]HNC09309.1 hypothetical protein [Anaerolineales bacterium]
MDAIIQVVIDTLIYLSRGIPGLVTAGVALVLMLLALIRKEAGMMSLAALLTLPVAYALGAWGGLLLVVRLLPLFSLASAFAISREDGIFAWGLATPPFGYLILHIFTMVLTDYTGG